MSQKGNPLFPPPSYLNTKHSRIALKLKQKEDIRDIV